MAEYNKQHFHTGADGIAGILFRTGNKPRTGVFKDLFESQLFKLNPEDSSTWTKAGHSLVENDARAILRSVPLTDGWTRFIQGHHLPNLYLQATSDHAVGTPVTYGNLTLTPLTYTYPGTTITRKDFLLQNILSFTSTGATVTITNPTPGVYNFETLGSDTYKIMLNALDASPDYIENKLGYSLYVNASLLKVKTYDSTTIHFTTGVNGLSASLQMSESTYAAETGNISHYQDAEGLWSRLRHDSSLVHTTLGGLGYVHVANPLIYLVSTNGSVGIGYNSTTRTYNLSCNCDSIGGYIYDQTNDTIFAGTDAGSGSDSTHSTFIGGDSGSNAEGLYLGYIGYEAGSSAIGNYNIGLGFGALKQNVASNVIGIGYEAGKDNTGDYCIFLGSGMGDSNTDNGIFALGDNNINVLPVIKADIETGKREYRASDTETTSISHNYDFSGVLESGEDKVIEIIPEVIMIDIAVKNKITGEVNRGSFMGTNTTLELILDKYCCYPDSSPGVDTTPAFSTIDEADHFCLFWDGTDLTIKNNTGILCTYVANIKYQDKFVVTYDDWVLPSVNAMQEIYDEIYLYGLGGFISGAYWTSTEIGATTAYAFQTSNGLTASRAKISTSYRARPIRTFQITETANSLNVRDTGQGGLIFYLINDGVTTTYYEIAPADITASVWSDIALLIGTTGSDIDDSYQNTLDIVAQTGFTTGVAQDCLDYSVDV